MASVHWLPPAPGVKTKGFNTAQSGQVAQTLPPGPALSCTTPLPSSLSFSHWPHTPTLLPPAHASYPYQDPLWHYRPLLSTLHRCDFPEVCAGFCLMPGPRAEAGLTALIIASSSLAHHGRVSHRVNEFTVNRCLPRVPGWP